MPNPFGDLIASGGLVDARQAQESGVRRKQGYDYAQQENGALAGMAEMPKMPDGCEGNPDFEAGYHEYYDERD